MNTAKLKEMGFDVPDTDDEEELYDHLLEQCTIFTKHVLYIGDDEVEFPNLLGTKISDRNNEEGKITSDTIHDSLCEWVGELVEASK